MDRIYRLVTFSTCRVLVVEKKKKIKKKHFDRIQFKVTLEIILLRHCPLMVRDACTTVRDWFARYDVLC